MRPRRFVELGTHFGYSYFAVCETVLNEGLSTQCIAVDTWQGDAHAGFYDETAFETVQAENARYAAFSTLQRKTFDEALADVEDGSVDLLHIDGRHFYEDVRHDYESWLPKLASDAVVLFHDTEVRDRGFGVYRLWADLARTYPSFNFLHGNGLGILFHGEKVPTCLTEMVAL
jgi:predicted O-methyltransferase YrrM